MTKQIIKELKILLKDLDSNIENDLNDSFKYWKASKLIHEHLVNVYIYNSENKDFGYMLYRKEEFRRFNDNLHYIFLAIQQKNIKIKSFMLAYTKMLDNFMFLKSFFNFSIGSSSKFSISVNFSCQISKPLLITKLKNSSLLLKSPL